MEKSTLQLLGSRAAFPDGHTFDDKGFLQVESNYGLTKREYMATAMMAAIVNKGGTGGTENNRLAFGEMAVQLADALLAQLDQ